ncbi:MULTISPECIES: hypothetical protein [unclassified Nocardia]|uniref:hypothetical protein n=1 Tax=unclassified Nocardia TaxID=2637762 RepID=UPI003416A2FA
MRATLAEELGLRDPEITWHVARDGFAEIVGLLAAIGGSVGKIGTDVATLCSTEFGELAEPHPHRNNPRSHDELRPRLDPRRRQPRRISAAAGLGTAMARTQLGGGER